jgi:hypothetical protein
MKFCSTGWAGARYSLGLMEVPQREDQLALLKAELDHMGTYGRQIYATWSTDHLSA